MKNLIAVLLLLAGAPLAAAQVPNAAAREALASLPESQGVLFVNARRITAEALPRVVPAARLRAAFDDTKKQTTIDLREIDFVVVGARFGGDAAHPSVPDFGVVIRGGFNADAMLSFFRMGVPGKFREERRGGKTVTVFKLDYDGEGKKGAAPDSAAAATASPAPAPDALALPSEIAAVSLDADSVLIGTPAYVASAIDARAEGGPRIGNDLVELALRDPDALVSLAATLPASLSKYLDSDKGAANAFLNDEMKRLLDSVRHVQASLNMTPARFGFQTVLRTDTPEDARAISGLVGVGVSSLEGEMAKKAGARRARQTADDRRLLELLRSITNVVADSDVTLGVGISQGTVAGFVSDMTGPPAKAPAKRPARRARRRA